MITTTVSVAQIDRAFEGCDTYGTLYVCYPATGEEIIVRPTEPTTEVGRELAELLRGE